MSGIASPVVLPRRFEASDSGRVTELLIQLCDEVEDSRKGKFWSLIIDGRSAQVSVVDVKDRLFDYEDALLKLDKEVAEFPEALEILFFCSSKTDSVAHSRLSECLAHELGGIACD